MSLLARRADHAELERHRALLAMRDSIVRATAEKFPDSGSAATSDAVDGALEQLLDAGAHLDALDVVKARWISWSRRRLTDTYRSAEFKLRDATPVDEHQQALSRSAADDCLAVGEDSRQWWRLQEILGSLSGPQREWAQAWLQQVSGSLAVGGHPRGLHDQLGWTAAKTKKTGQRARRKMVAFIQERESGSICSDRQALLDDFISTTTHGVPAHRQAGELDKQRYEAVLLHICGCEDCFGAWRNRRRALLARCIAIIMLPLDSAMAAAHACTGKLARLLAGAQELLLSVLGRVGIGGGATAAAGGSAAAISTKTAAVCVGVVCAAGAGVGEITGVLPPVVRKDPPQQRQEAVRKATPAPERQTVRTPAAPVPASTRPATQPTAAATTSLPAKRAVTALRTTPAPGPRSTPGDLPPASPSTSSSPTRTFSRSPSATTATATCTPGDLGC